MVRCPRPYLIPFAQDTEIGHMVLTAKFEPFDSFWEGPEDVESGYNTFGRYYKRNYWGYLPADHQSRILAISCGPGYFVNLLTQAGYTNVLGIDSSSEKIAYARKRDLNCTVAQAFPFLQARKDEFHLIFCEQEINHLTKEEILTFLRLCHDSLRERGILIIHSLNGANPITGAEALAQNFDHYNTFTEYPLRQILRYCGFEDINVIPLKLYVFYENPLNYLCIGIDALLTLSFRLSFILYGKSNRVFTKKIAAICRKRPVAAPAANL